MEKEMEMEKGMANGYSDPDYNNQTTKPNYTRHRYLPTFKQHIRFVPASLFSLRLFRSGTPLRMMPRDHALVVRLVVQRGRYMSMSSGITLLLSMIAGSGLYHGLTR